MVVDTNVLLAAFRVELDQHALARAWLTRQLADGTDLIVPNVVRVSFVRLATRSLGPFPGAPLEKAAAFLDAIARVDHLSPADLTSRTLSLCVEHRLSGDGSVDAWIAAHAIAAGLPLVSFDRGFAKFRPQLDWQIPT